MMALSAVGNKKVCVTAQSRNSASASAAENRPE